MILEALHRHYDRLFERGEPGLSPFGYSPQKISYAVVLSLDGEPVDVVPLLEMQGKKQVPRLLGVPQSETRTSAIKPNFLWDKTSYALGVSATSKRTAEEHAAFKAFHDSALKDETDAGLVALRRFLHRWTPARFDSPPFAAHREGMVDANLVFRLDDEHQYVHESPAARELRARLLARDAEGAENEALDCLVTNRRGPAARLHPAIKEVNGAQSSGAALVSFNLDAFTSYGKSQGDNAPVSELAAFGYTSALNHLLRRDPQNRQRLSLGDATVVFWAEAPDADEAAGAEWLTAMMLDPDLPDDDAQAAEKVRHALDAVSKGRPVAEIDPRLDAGTRMFVLGLAPNASRLSVRYWLVDSLGALADRLADHARDLHIEPVPWRKPPSVRRLALATAPERDGRSKADDVSPLLAGELMRAVLTGGRYPQSLLATLILRMRSDGVVSGLRVAMCKAVLQRDARLRRGNASTEEDLVSLDINSTNPGYVLGRLFSVLENVQRSALGRGLNATIRDRYYGAASASPASIFPMLLRNTQNHMSRLRKDNVGAAVNLERDVQEIVDKLSGEFPRSLNIQEQGRFAIGYYHQTQARYAKKGGAEAGESAESTDTQAQGGNE